MTNYLHHKYIYPLFVPCRKEEGAIVPVPVWNAPDTINAKLHLVGSVVIRHVSVLITKQGTLGTVVGPTEGKPQDHDVPEDGKGLEELFTHWRDSESEEEAHLPLWWEDAERPSRRLEHSVKVLNGSRRRISMKVQTNNGCPVSAYLHSRGHWNLNEY